LRVLVHRNPHPDTLSFLNFILKAENAVAKPSTQLTMIQRYPSTGAAPTPHQWVRTGLTSSAFGEWGEGFALLAFVTWPDILN